MEEGTDALLLGGDGAGGGGQADRGLGGAITPKGNDNKEVNSGLKKCYKNTIRLELSRIKEHQKVNHNLIIESFKSRFGPQSKQVQGIIAIGQGSDDLTWFIAYNESIPKNTINTHNETVNDAYVLINNIKAYLFNASESNESTNERVKGHRSQFTKSNRFLLSFRVHGLPLDVKQCEVFEVLKNIGLEIAKKEDLSQVCIKDSMIRTEMVDFKIDCNSENEEQSVTSVVKQTSFIGNHEVIIGEYKYQIKVICFGFCNVCKKSGHKSFECDVRIKMREDRLINVKCNLCEEMGHYSKGCPNKEKILSERLAKTRCHKCREFGHLSNTCVNDGPVWIINTPIIDKTNSTEQVSDLQYNNYNNAFNSGNNNNNEQQIVTNNTFNSSSPNNNITIAVITGHQIVKQDSSGTKRSKEETSISLESNDPKKVCDVHGEDTLDDSSLSMNTSKASISSS